MKTITLITSLFVFFIITIGSANAYKFLDTTHDTQWNDTAEQEATPYDYAWTDLYQAGFSYSTDNPFNGLKSIKAGDLTSYMTFDGTNYENSTDFFLEYMLYDNISMTSGNFIVGITPNSGSGYFGGLYVTNNNLYYDCIEHDLLNGEPQNTSTVRSTGWHDIIYNVTNNGLTVEITSDGTSVCTYTINGSGNAELVGIGKFLRIATGMADGHFFLDDLHFANGTIAEEIQPPVVNYTLTFRANDTNTSTFIDIFAVSIEDDSLSTINGTAIIGEYSNGTFAATATATGFFPKSDNITIAGDTEFTFQMVESPPAPPLVVNYTVVITANDTNTSTPINNFVTTFDGGAPQTVTNFSATFLQIDNGTHVITFQKSGYISSTDNVSVAGNTDYTFQIVESPVPPQPVPAPPENQAITIIIVLFAVVALLGYGIYEYLPEHMQSIVYKYAAWIVGAIAAIAVIMILANM